MISKIARNLARKFLYHPRIDFLPGDYYNFYKTNIPFKGGPSLKYLKQFTLIILFSFLGELCRYLIPYPIPGSIYGMVLMFAALSLKIVKIENIRDGGYFLTSCLPILFVAPVVNLMDCWDQIKANWLAMVLIVVVSTLVTFGISGMVTQWVINRRKAGGENE